MRPASLMVPATDQRGIGFLTIASKQGRDVLVSAGHIGVAIHRVVGVSIRTPTMTMTGLRVC